MTIQPKDLDQAGLDAADGAALASMQLALRGRDQTRAVILAYLRSVGLDEVAPMQVGMSAAQDVIGDLA